MQLGNSGIVVVVLGSLFSACASSRSSLRVVTPASEGQRAALFQKVAALEGTWQKNDPQHKDAGPQTSNVFKVSSNGSIVREVMFPGTEHEMTNVYHMDGPDLVLTHYCAMGNQPSMRAHAGGDANAIDFQFDGVSNLRAQDELYMGSMRVVFVDPTHIRQEWTSYKQGQVDHSVSFELTKVK